MKKTFKLLLIAMLAFTLSVVMLACGGQENNNSGQPVETPEVIVDKLPDYTPEVTAPYGQLPDLDGVVIDGKLDDELWKGKKWYSTYDTGARVGLFVTATTSEKGLYVASYSTDKSVFWTYRNHFEVNTHFQIYIKTDAGEKNFSFDANNIAPTRYSVNARTYVDGRLNLVGQANGLSVEFFATWEELGFASRPETVQMLPLYKFKESETRSLQTLYPTFQKMLTGGFDDYYEFDKNGSVIGDEKDATVGNHEIGLGKTNVWSVEADEEGQEVVTANGARRLFGQAIFFREQNGNYFRVSARIKARNIDSSKTRAGLLIYNNNIAYRAPAIELSSDCYSDGNLHTIKLSGYTDYPKGTTVTTEFATIENKKGSGRAQDEVDLELYYVSGKAFYIVNGSLVYSEVINYLNNCYIGLYSFNSSAQFTNLDCYVYETADEAQMDLSDYAYMINVENEDHLRAKVEADKLCVPKKGREEVTLTFTCAEGYTVDDLYLETEDGEVVDLTEKAEQEGENGTLTIDGIDCNVTIYCTPKEIEEQTVDAKLYFYSKDDGEEDGKFGSAKFILTGNSAFTRYEITASSSDGIYGVAVPAHYKWTYKTEIAGFRSVTGALNDGNELNESMVQPIKVGLMQNVVGGVASDESGRFVVSSTPGSIWDLNNEENDEVYFQTANNKHTTIYFSGKTVSNYHVAYVEITNQTDPLAFTSLERDPAVGFVFQTGRYEYEGKAMLRFAGMRLVPDGVWANKVDTGTIFSGYTGYDVSTNKGVISGDPYLGNGGTVNRLSYAGREDTTCLLMIRADEKVYFYVADGSKKVKSDGTGFENLTYLYEFEHEGFGGDCAIGLGATVSYNLRLKFANYWILSGDDAKAFADGKITSTMKVESGDDYLKLDGAGMYSVGENQYKVSGGSDVTATVNGLESGKILALTFDGRTQYASNGDKVSLPVSKKGASYSLYAEAVDAITVSGSVGGYDAKLHGTLDGFMYLDGKTVATFTVKNGEFEIKIPKGESIEIEVGKGQFLSEKVDLSSLGSDADIGEIEMIALPFGGTVTTDAGTRIDTNCVYDFSYDRARGAVAHTRIESAERVLNTLALQTEGKKDAVIKFTYSRKSAAQCGSTNGIDEGALGVGITMTDGKTLRSMLFLRKGIRIYGNNHNGITVDKINELYGNVEFSGLSVEAIDVMFVKHGSTFYALNKYGTDKEYDLVYVWKAEENGSVEFAGKCNFGITISLGKARFVDFTVSNVSVEDYTVGDVKELFASVDCQSDAFGEITVDSGYESKNGNVYSVIKNSSVTVTVKPAENNIISSVFVGDKKIALDGYVSGDYTFVTSVSQDAIIRAEYVSADDVCFVNGEVVNYDGNFALLKGTVYDQTGAIGTFAIDGNGEFTVSVPKDKQLWLEIGAHPYQTERIALGVMQSSKSVGEVKMYSLPFGGTVTTPNGTKLNTIDGYQYSVDENGAVANIKVDGAKTYVHALTLQTEAMENAVIKFSYSRKSAAESGSSIKDEGAIGIGITATDGKTLRTMLLMRRGYRVLANNNNGSTLDLINQQVNAIDFSSVSVERIDLMAIKRGSYFYMLCKNANQTEYSLVFTWEAKENGITELGGKANFALSFMIAKGYFANVTFSNVTVEALNESDFPALFG